MEYHLKLPIKKELIKKLKIKDIVYLTGKIFTSRDEGHRLMLKKDRNEILFAISEMALFHCGPLMKKEDDKWRVISLGPTTSSRMEIFEDRFIKKFGFNLIIGKGGMGKKTENALKKYSCIYMAHTGGVAALAADKVEEVIGVYWLDELGMLEATWIFKVKEFGPLVVAMDSNGNSIYKNIKNKRN